MGNVIGNFFEPDMTQNTLKKKSKSSQKESNQFDQLLVINPANARYHQAKFRGSYMYKLFTVYIPFMLT